MIFPSVVLILITSNLLFNDCDLTNASIIGKWFGIDDGIHEFNSSWCCEYKIQ